MQSRDVSKRLSTFFLCLLAIVPYTTFSHLLYHHHIGTLVGTLYRVTMYIVTKMKGRKKKKKKEMSTRLLSSSWRRALIGIFYTVYVGARVHVELKEGKIVSALWGRKKKKKKDIRKV